MVHVIAATQQSFRGILQNHGNRQYWTINLKLMKRRGALEFAAADRDPSGSGWQRGGLHGPDSASGEQGLPPDGQWQTRFGNDTMKIRKSGAVTATPFRYRTVVLMGCTALVAFAPTSLLAQDAASASPTVLEAVTVEGAGAAVVDDDGDVVRTVDEGEVADIVDAGL